MGLPCLAGNATSHVARNKSVQSLCAAFSTSSIVEAQKKVAKKREWFSVWQKAILSGTTANDFPFATV